MVRSESADEDQILVDDQYDMMDDNDIMDTTRSVESWNVGPFSTLTAAAAAAAARSHAPLLANRSVSQPSSLSPTSGGGSGSISGTADPDRRLRRQIANCNERRRMQSINAGFMSLRALLPRKEGEKLSKAAILQQTADLIHRLLDERADGAVPKKLPKMDVSGTNDQDSMSEARATISRLQSALEREKTIRAHLEHQLFLLQTEPKTEEPSYSSPSSSPQHDELQLSMEELAPAPAATTASAAAALCSLSMMALNNTSPLQNFETSVIRPTPLAPISVDVSSPSLSTPSTPILVLPPPTSTNLVFPMMSAVTQPATPTYHPIQSSISSAFSSTGVGLVNGVGGGPASHASLQTILDAIKHLESNANLQALQQAPPTSQAPLVR